MGVMSKPKVFVTRLIPAAGLDRVKSACDAEVWTDPLPPPPAVLREKTANCEGLLSLLTDRIDAAFLDACPKLRVISNYAVGFNNVDVAAATERGIRVGNTPGVLTDATADLAFALLIAAARRVVEGHAYSRSGAWKTWEPMGHVGQDLAGRTLGIVGMGRIGFALAKRCRGGWGMNVLYNDLHRHEEAERSLGARRVDLDRLLAESDFVSVHANLTEGTHGMFDAAAFRKMKRTAVFVNTARGALVKEKDLHDALKAGVLFAAGLDVTDPEPPAKDNPLLSLPNCVVAPHIASATVATRTAMANIAADNLLAGLGGRDLPHWVNPESAAHGRGA
jgi:glyoxylate reductase